MFEEEQDYQKHRPRMLGKFGGSILTTCIGGVLAGIIVYHYQLNMGSENGKMNKERFGIPKLPASSQCRPDDELPTSTVLAGSYEIPPHIKDFILLAGLQPVVIKTNFDVMRREVNVGDFHRFLNSLSAEEQKSVLKSWGDHEDVLSRPGDTPLYGVPVATALYFAETLATRTSCRYDLPTYDQWLAAVAANGDPDTVVRDERHAGDLPTPRASRPDAVYDLLGNLREWSAQSCPSGGYYLFGEDYLTRRSALLGEPLCTRYPHKTAGFRLVMNEVKP